MYAPSLLRGAPTIKTALLAQLVVFSVAGCSSDHGAVSRIPGTEKAAVESSIIGDLDVYAISVSRSERYLIFWENEKKPAGAEQQSGLRFPKAACIDLVTGERTGFKLDATKHTWNNHIGRKFVPQCWHEDTCYIPVEDPGDGRRRRLRTLAFVPGSPRVTYADDPGELTCSDCAPRELLKQTIKRRLGSSWRPGEDTFRFSIPWKDGRFGDRLYYIDSSAIYVRENDEDTILLEKTGRLRELTMIRLRVSPDESFIAFTLWKKIKAPIPLPDYIDEVHVLDVETRRSKLVRSYRNIGNYIWSPDSKRLYYVAYGQDPDDKGVYVVDVPKLFGHSGDD